MQLIKFRGGVAGLLLLDECETFVEVSILYVLQKYRGSNISLLMIYKAKQYAKEKGKVIKLYCDKSMIALYEKMGFKQCESLAVMIYDDFLI